MISPPLSLHIERRHKTQLWIRGTVVDNAPHRHHALQIVWANHGTLLTLNSGETSIQTGALLIGGGVSHQLDMPQGLICLLDAESRDARTLRDTWLTDKDIAVLSPQEDLDAPQDLLHALLPEREPALANLDPRIHRTLRHLDDMEAAQRWNEVNLAKVLERTGLSRSRFLHLFTQEVGTPWRGYLLWRRALIAMELAHTGMSLTRAAHEAGYADAAHLSRQFRQLFGYAPSLPLRHSTFVQS